MFDPSSDDPRRVLYAAARWMVACGTVHLAFGGLFILAGLGSLARASIGACMASGGIMFLICASGARRHRRWALWWGIAMGLILGVGVAMGLALLVSAIGWHDLVRLKSLIATLPVVLLVAFLLVHVMIVWNLSNSFEALPLPVPTASRPGFDALVVPTEPRPVLPVEAVDDDAAAAR
jgi:hypothetical protein